MTRSEAQKLEFGTKTSAALIVIIAFLVASLGYLIFFG